MIRGVSEVCSMATKKNKKVIRYRKPMNINIGMIIFALIFAYMAFYVYTYMKRERIEFYEVTEGSIVNDQRHSGIILRTEVPKYTDCAGNINYYLREGKKAAVGTRIYSIDETGTLSKLLEERMGDSVVLSGENLSSLKKELSSFSQTFSDVNFNSVYDTRYSLDSKVLEYVSVDTLKNLDDAIEELGGNFEQVRSDAAGIVSYSVDGLESLSPEQVSEDLFDRSNYKKNVIKSGQLVEKGAPAYKLITEGNWSIVFPMTDEEKALYSQKTSLSVKFIGKDLKTSGSFSIIAGADGGSYGKLDFNKYMEQFVSDRFVDFEIITEEVKGLKIPRSAVTEVSFFQIPRDFLVRSPEGSARGFYKETYTENGPGVVLVSCDIFHDDGEYYYVDAGEKSELKAGDYIVKENSQDRFQVGTMATLQGVYNINRGYTMFRRIVVLNSNDEYYTVEKGTSYGLSVYDHIVLNAAAVKENDTIIYQ